MIQSQEEDFASTYLACIAGCRCKLGGLQSPALIEATDVNIRYSNCKFCKFSLATSIRILIKNCRVFHTIQLPVISDTS